MANVANRTWKKNTGRRLSALAKEYYGYKAYIEIDGERYMSGTVGKMEIEANRLTNAGLTREIGVTSNNKLKIFTFVHARK